jgi:hypothetical protein
MPRAPRVIAVQSEKAGVVERRGRHAQSIENIPRIVLIDAGDVDLPLLLTNRSSVVSTSLAMIRSFPSV